jgi:hypothetical protein
LPAIVLMSAMGRKRTLRHDAILALRDADELWKCYDGESSRDQAALPFIQKGTLKCAPFC